MHARVTQNTKVHWGGQAALVGLTGRQRPPVVAALELFKEPEAVQSVEAKFADGVLQPLDALDPDEGQAVMVSMDDRPPSRRPGRGIRAAAGAWKGTHDPERLKRDIYAGRLDRCHSCARSGSVAATYVGWIS